MVRIYSILAAFVAVTLGLVLLQPSLDDATNTSPRPAETVSRDVVNLLDTVEPAPLDALVAQALAEAVNAPVLPSAAAPAAPMAVAVTPPGTTTPSKDLEALTWATLGNLQRASGQTHQPGKKGSLLYHLVQRSVAATTNAGDAYAASLRAEAASY